MIPHLAKIGINCRHYTGQLLIDYPGKYSVRSFLVDHLHHADDSSPDADGHAEDGPGGVASLLINALVESVISVNILDIEGLSRLRNISSDPCSNGKPSEK